MNSLATFVVTFKLMLHKSIRQVIQLLPLASPSFVQWPLLCEFKIMRKAKNIYFSTYKVTRFSLPSLRLNNSFLSFLVSPLFFFFFFSSLFSIWWNFGQFGQRPLSINVANWLLLGGLNFRSFKQHCHTLSTLQHPSLNNGHLILLGKICHLCCPLRSLPLVESHT